MAKLLLLACVFASSIFMLTQIIFLYYFDNFYFLGLSDNEPHVKDSLLRSVKQLQLVCKHFNLDLVLIDEDILQEFLKSEISHRKSGIHNHQNCQIFCSKSFVTFMIQGIKLDDGIEELTISLQQKGYLVSYDEDYDKRQESVEQRHGRDKLIYHLFLEANETLIHIVLTYPRGTYLWNHLCNAHKLPNEKWIPLVEKSRFCNRENIFRLIDTTAALLDGIYLEVPQYLSSFLDEIKSSTFLSCDYQQARSFYSHYGYDSTFESEKFRKKADQLLEIVTVVMSTLNVRFWLSSGTCLGWFRQCDFIPHSKDLDIGIWIDDYNNKIIETFKHHGLKLKHMFGKVEDSFELSFTLEDLKLDIFFFYKNKNYMWNGGTQAKSGRKFKYIFSNFDLCWTKFRTLLVRVPCDTKKYILANYGESWYTLVKSWDWKSSPSNVQENGEWSLAERDKVIKVY